MGSTPLKGCVGYFLKFLFSNFHSHIKDSKWGKKYIFMNYTCCNRSPQQIPVQFANGILPHSRCRAFQAMFRLPQDFEFPISFKLKAQFLSSIKRCEEEDEEKIFAVIPDCSPFWLDPVYCLRLWLVNAVNGLFSWFARKKYASSTPKF